MNINTLGRRKKKNESILLPAHSSANACVLACDHYISEDYALISM